MNRLLCFLLSISLTCCQKPQEMRFTQRNQLNLSFKYDPLTTDPTTNADPLTCSFLNMLYEGLLHEEPDGSASLALAESYEISKSGTVYTFRLKDAKWSNGESITSYDFEYSWKKILDPSFNSPNAHFLYPIKNAQNAKKGLTTSDSIGIFCPDEKTLEIKLTNQSPHFLKMLCFPTFYPTHRKESERDLEKHPFGIFSGPFKLVAWKKNDYLTLKKNPDFWDASHTNIETIHISIISNELTSYRLFELGEIDWMGSFFSPLPQGMIREVKNNPYSISSEIAATTFCFFNNKCYPFNNINIRKAFAYALDRKDIADNFMEGGEKIAYGMIPPILLEEREDKLMPNGSEELALHYFETGLKELGLTRRTFPTLTFDYLNFEESRKLAEVLLESWRKVLNLEVRLQSFEVKIFLDKIFKKNYQFCLMSIIAQYQDPFNFLERFMDKEGTKNFCGWNNPKFNEYLEYANNSLSEEIRMKYFTKAESIFMMEMPVAPIYHQSRIYARNELLQDVEYCITGRVDFRHAHFNHKKE